MNDGVFNLIVLIVIIFTAIIAVSFIWKRRGSGIMLKSTVSGGVSHDPENNRSSAMTAKPPKRTEGPPQVLIVDDQPAIRMLLAEVFQSTGLIVHEASNGRSAIDKFRSEPVDFVLLDLKMPDIDGIEVLRVIRELDEQVQVVMISAYGDAEKIEVARRLGVNKFFTKPFDIEKLRDYVLSQLQAQD